MPTWVFTAPDGTEYEVEGADKKGAFQALQDKIRKDVHAEYENMPLWKKPVQAADDLLRISSNFVTSLPKLAGIPGTKRDEWAQYLGGGTPEEEAFKTAKARERSGSAGLAAEMLPMLAVPELAPELVAGASPLATGMTEGAIFGGGHAAAHDESIIPGVLTGIATGGVAGAGSAVNKAIKGIPRNVVAPTIKELGKLRLVPHGLAAAGPLLGASAIPGSPVNAGLSLLAGVGIPVAGAVARSAHKGLKSALGKAAKEQTTHFNPDIQRLLTYLGVGGEQEPTKDKYLGGR